MNQAVNQERPSRREILRPLTLLGIAFACAVFAGVVTALSMGVVQEGPVDQMSKALITALVVAGITFIVVVLTLALLLLVVDPAEVKKTIDRPVLFDDEPADAGAEAAAGADNGSKPDTSAS